MTPMPPIHPAAGIFPMLPERQLQELADNIRQQGQKVAIIMWRGQLLDGRNRWMGCDRAGVEPLLEHRNHLTPEEAFDLAITLNLHRRHLDDSQRAMAAARARGLFEEQARERMSMGGRATQGDPDALANLRTADVGRADEHAAKLMDVSPRSVMSARIVLATAIPELQERVDQGLTAVSTAAELARAPAEQQQEIVAKGEKEIVAEAKRINRERTQARRLERTEKLAVIAQGNRPLEVGPERFPVVYADPSWKYDAGTTDPTRRVDQKYPTMDVEEIKALPVSELATESAVLYLWAVNPLLPEALEVMRAWGFTYKTNWSWDKEIAGMGVWGFGQHELLLIGTRGEMPTAPESTRPPSVLRARREGEHSSKPVEAAERIERMFPTLPKIELFARGEPRPGWRTWGNQALPAPAPDPQAGLFDAVEPPAAPVERVELEHVEEPDDDEPPPPPTPSSDYHCNDCNAGPGELHGKGCDDEGSRLPTIAEMEARGAGADVSHDWRAGAFDKRGELVAAAHGCTESEAREKIDGWQKQRPSRVASVELANPDGVVVERREKVGKTWATRREEPKADAPAEGPLYCRAPNEAEKAALAREFPDFVKPLAAPPPLPANHPARTSKKAGALIKHAESAIKAGNFDSALEAIEELDGISSPALKAEESRDAAARLRAIAQHGKAQPEADEPPAPKARKGLTIKVDPEHAAKVDADFKETFAEHDRVTARAKAKAPRTPKQPADPEPTTITDLKLIKAITGSYSADKVDKIGKPVEIDEALWINMGGSSKGSAHLVMLWRVVPMEEWSGRKDTYDSAELLERWESGATWRGDRTGYQAKQGAAFYVFTGQRRAYRWGGK